MRLLASCKRLHVLWQQSGTPAPGVSWLPTGASFCTAAAEVDHVDAVVIGAGVVGLACARALALAGQEVLLLEQHPSFGTETSSRHSEVIHAGIYYPRGSLKARLCVEGKARLYEYCSSKGIPHDNITKLIVATSKEQAPQLEKLKEAAAHNGVTDLQMLSQEEAASLEPALHAVQALLSPSTGILDSHSYMEALLADAQAAGAALAVNSQVMGSKPGPGGKHHQLEVRDTSSGEVSKLSARRVVNAAGLHAQAVARRLAELPSSTIPPQYLAKGHYFTLSGKSPFSRLIYPLPEPGLGGLGVHLTLDMGGQAKFGPDVAWVEGIDYTLDPDRAAAFYPAIRAYYPELPEGALSPSYTGVRPKVSGPGQPAADFLIQGRGVHGVRGLVCLYGIESPGLTSSLAIAEHVVQMLKHDE